MDWVLGEIVRLDASLTFWNAERPDCHYTPEGYNEI